MCVCAFLQIIKFLKICSNCFRFGNLLCDVLRLFVAMFCFRFICFVLAMCFVCCVLLQLISALFLFICCFVFDLGMHFAMFRGCLLRFSVFRLMCFVPTMCVMCL